MSTEPYTGQRNTGQPNTGQPPAGQDCKEHDERPRRLDLVNLVAGVVFLAMAIAFTVADMDSLETQVRIVWPTSLLAIGAGMLLGLRRR